MPRKRKSSESAGAANKRRPRSRSSTSISASQESGYIDVGVDIYAVKSSPVKSIDGISPRRSCRISKRRERLSQESQEREASTSQQDPEEVPEEALRTDADFEDEQDAPMEALEPSTEQQDSPTEPQDSPTEPQDETKEPQDETNEPHTVPTIPEERQETTGQEQEVKAVTPVTQEEEEDATMETESRAEEQPENVAGTSTAAPQEVETARASETESKQDEVSATVEATSTDNETSEQAMDINENITGSPANDTPDATVATTKEDDKKESDCLPNTSMPPVVESTQDETKVCETPTQGSTTTTEERPGPSQQSTQPFTTWRNNTGLGTSLGEEFPLSQVARNTGPISQTPAAETCLSQVSEPSITGTDGDWQLVDIPPTSDGNLTPGTQNNQQLPFGSYRESFPRDFVHPPTTCRSDESLAKTAAIHNVMAMRQNINCNQGGTEDTATNPTEFPQREEENSTEDDMSGEISDSQLYSIGEQQASSIQPESTTEPVPYRQPVTNLFYPPPGQFSQ